VGQLEPEGLLPTWPPPGYNDPGGGGTAFSAYVLDNAVGPTYTTTPFVSMATPPAVRTASLTLVSIGRAGLMAPAARGSRSPNGFGQGMRHPQQAPARA